MMKPRAKKLHAALCAKKGGRHTPKPKRKPKYPARVDDLSNLRVE